MISISKITNGVGGENQHDPTDFYHLNYKYDYCHTVKYIIKKFNNLDEMDKFYNNITKQKNY